MFGMTKKKISEQVAKQRINAALKPYLYPQGLQYWTDRFDQGGVECWVADLSSAIDPNQIRRNWNAEHHDREAAGRQRGSCRAAQGAPRTQRVFYGLFQLHSPADKPQAESLEHRAQVMNSRPMRPGR